MVRIGKTTRLIFFGAPCICRMNGQGQLKGYCVICRSRSNRIQWQQNCEKNRIATSQQLGNWNPFDDGDEWVRCRFSVKFFRLYPYRSPELRKGPCLRIQSTCASRIHDAVAKNLPASVHFPRHSFLRILEGIRSLYRPTSQSLTV